MSIDKSSPPGLNAGSFAITWADALNEPTVSYPTAGRIKYTVINGDLVILEFPEMGLSSIGVADVVKVTLPAALRPAVHPDGIWKYQVIGVNSGAETIGTAIIDPADGLLQLEPDSGSWDSSGTIIGFTMAYHLTWS